MCLGQEGVQVLLSESPLCRAKKIQMRLAIKAPAREEGRQQERRTPQARMSQPATPPITQQTETNPKPAKRPRTRKTDTAGATTFYDTARDSYSILVRSLGPVDRCVSLSLRLTVPDTDEECSITMEPMSEYRLPFIPASFKKGHLIKDQPRLTKATLPCGHSFCALAVLYHFAKNSMTCPCCRAGHTNEKMGEQSVPQHIRKYFSKHLATDRAEDVREQIRNDAAVAARMLQHEVRYEMMPLPVTRMVLSLSAFSSMDRSSAPDPMLVLELPLTSSLTMGSVESVSFGYSLHQLNLNLRLLPVGIRAFEMAIGVRSLHHHEWASVALFKTLRFSAEGRDLVRVVPALGGDPRLNVVVSMVGTDGVSNPQFARISWTVGAQAFTDLLISTSQALAMEPGEIAAV